MQVIKKPETDDPRQSIGYDKPAQSGQTSSNPTLMRQLWLRLAEIYGHQFVSQYGDSPCKSWSAILADVDSVMMAEGLRRLSERDSEWPPNAVEFRKLCLKPTASPTGMHSQAYQPYRPALPGPSTKELGNRVLADLKALLEDKDA